MIPLVIFLLACAAIYPGAIEAAFSAFMRLSVRLVAERSGRPDALGEYLDDPLLLLIPVRLLLGLVTAGATVLLSRAIGLEGARALALVILAVVAFVVVCELLVPVAIVRRDPEGALELLLRSFVPVVRLLGPCTRWIARAVVSSKRPAAPPTPNASRDPSSEAAAADHETAAQEALNEGEERKLLQNIVDFGDTLVREVMTPRPDIVAIRDTATVGELRALFAEQEYSRFPVFKDSLDNIAGFVFVKDLVALGVADDARPISTLMRPAVVVPETKRVPELLKQFQRLQAQCAIVVDEDGGTAGLVTAEDLEEIVGEIRDEYDVESDPIVDEGNGSFLFSGKVDIDEVVQRLKVPIEREGFETVGGYLLSHVGRVPTIGEHFEIDGLSVDVLDAERRRVNKVRISKPEIRASLGEWAETDDTRGGGVNAEAKP